MIQGEMGSWICACCGGNSDSFAMAPGLCTPCGEGIPISKHGISYFPYNGWKGNQSNTQPLLANMSDHDLKLVWGFTDAELKEMRAYCSTPDKAKNWVDEKFVNERRKLIPSGDAFFRISVTTTAPKKEEAKPELKLTGKAQELYTLLVG